LVHQECDDLVGDRCGEIEHLMFWSDNCRGRFNECAEMLNEDNIGENLLKVPLHGVFSSRKHRLLSLTLSLSASDSTVNAVNWTPRPTDSHQRNENTQPFCAVTPPVPHWKLNSWRPDEGLSVPTSDRKSRPATVTHSVSVSVGIAHGWSAHREKARRRTYGSSDINFSNHLDYRQFFVFEFLISV
jgi:hypothetical protein